jgi:hypothetical protein
MLSTEGYIPSSKAMDKDETEGEHMTADSPDEGGYFVDINSLAVETVTSALNPPPHHHHPSNGTRNSSSSSNSSLPESKAGTSPWPLHQVVPAVVQPVTVTAETDTGIQGRSMPPLHTHTTHTNTTTTTTTASLHSYSKDTFAGIVLNRLSSIFIAPNSLRSGSAFAGFLSLLLITMANYMLGPMRDAAALRVGVSYIPMLTMASTTIALASSVPMGWLFEAPNPTRKGKHWRHRVGLTRGETQGTSLALFLRCFAVCLVGYAITFKLMYLLSWKSDDDEEGGNGSSVGESGKDLHLLVDLYQSFQFRQDERLLAFISRVASKIMEKFGKFFYVAFFLVVHLMKLHSISLMWGVTSEAMEYEEQAELRQKRRERAQRLNLNRILKVNESIREDDNEDNTTKTNGKLKSSTRKGGEKSR